MSQFVIYREKMLEVYLTFLFYSTDCSEIADIAFLVDASESMTMKDFETQKEVIKKIAATFDVGPTKSHLGLMTFSSHAQVRVKFRDNLDMRSFQETVNKLPFAAGGTRFDKAFEEAANNLFSPSGGVRSHLPKVFVILTDGKQSADYDAVPIEQSVLQLRHLGVRILALAIGSQVDMNELLQIVNEPKDIYAANDFDTLLGNTDEVGKLTCGIVKRPGKLKYINVYVNYPVFTRTRLIQQGAQNVFNILLFPKVNGNAPKGDRSTNLGKYL